jgi:hypothetical protein
MLMLSTCAIMPFGMRFSIGLLLIIAVILVAPRQTALGAAAPERAQPDRQPFSEEVVQDLLSKLYEGIIAQDRAGTLGLFDRERMPGYADFASRIELMLGRYDSFRVGYRLLQTSEGTGTNAAMVDFTLEAIPADENQLPVRASAQLRFTFSRGEGGWKISDLQPREFFDQF